ncbi:hypothetical protein Ancab_000911 [Ancistrocladus abbreviatus]
MSINYHISTFKTKISCTTCSRCSLFYQLIIDPLEFKQKLPLENSNITNSCMPSLYKSNQIFSKLSYQILYLLLDHLTHNDARNRLPTVSGLMASLVLFLLLLPMTALGDNSNTSPPSLKSTHSIVEDDSFSNADCFFFGLAVSDICSQVACGKGTCKSSVSPFAFECECDSGWRRTLLSEIVEQNLQFLPCIIPNCSINYSDMPAAPPMPAIPPDPYNISFYDPCHWIYCGEGTCTNSSDHTRTCQCQPGAYNLFNNSHFPCYIDSAIGSDCSNLGIKVSNGSPTPGSSSSSSSSSESTSANHASQPFSSGKLNWIIVMLMSMMIMPLKYRKDH